MNYFSFIEDFRQMGMLFEGIDDMRKFYKNIPEDEFISYIELDPTYKQGSNKAGTYAKWILGLANNDKLKDKNHVKDLLKRFEENKKNLKDKDIMKFKSMDELESYLNNDDSYNELSHRQEVRQRQKDRRNVDLGKDAELIYEDDDWEVWIPKTYAASCRLGQGTSWCTASTETSEYYDEYTSDGNLFININKHNPGEKYQFHFESGSYMDKDDDEIDVEDFFLKNEKLYKKCYQDLYKFDIDEVRQHLDLFLQKSGGIYEYSGGQVPNYIRDFVRIVKIQNDVTSIDAGAFSDCNSLTSITIPNSVISIGNSAFSGCSSLASIVIPDGVISIGDYAFMYCDSLMSVVIHNSVTSIGECAFYGCGSLTSIIIPDSVTSIGWSAFGDCSSLTTVKYMGDISGWCNISFRGSYANPMYYAKELYINDTLMAGELIIPDSVTSIGYESFAYCSRLTKIVIPDSVTSIGYRAFYSCDSLTSVIIPDSVTSIGYQAFDGCSILNEIKYTGNAQQWKQIKKGKDWAKGIPTKSIRLVDSVGIDENFKIRNKHIQ